MKPALLIDFDGTLCHDRFWRTLEPDLQSKVQNHLFVLNREITGYWMKGHFTSEEINKKLSEDLEISYKRLWETFVSDCESMFIEQRTLEQINKLRKHYTVILVTDNMDCFDRFTVPALGLRNYFDEIINSFNEKISKNDNDGQSFKKVISNVKSTISESILMDNSEKSCDVFQKFGGKSYLVTKEQPLFFWLEKLLK